MSPSRGYVHFTADLPDSENELTHPLDIGDGLAGVESVVEFGVRLQHDCLALRTGTRCDLLPDLFGDEGHERVHQSQQRFEHFHERALRAAPLRI